MAAMKIFWKNKLVGKVIKNFNLFDATGLFLYPLKVSENQMISDVFFYGLILWRAPTSIQFSISSWNFAHVSYLPMSAKGCAVFFFILLRSWVICKNLKDLVSTRSSFTLLLITQDLNKIKKNPEHPFVDTVK